LIVSDVLGRGEIIIDIGGNSTRHGKPLYDCSAVEIACLIKSRKAALHSM